MKKEEGKMKNPQAVTPDRQELVEKHLPLVRWVVLNYFCYNDSAVGLELDDLCQEGAVALCRAADTYKSGKTAFSTYAVKVIRNHLLSYCRNISTDMRHLPTVALNEGDRDEENPQNSCEFEAESITNLCASDILRRRKGIYKGAARRGLEALELRVLQGYGVTDIAYLYGMKPNLVGAWISKAAKQMREDLTRTERETLGVVEMPKIA